MDKLLIIKVTLLALIIRLVAELEHAYFIDVVSYSFLGILPFFMGFILKNKIKTTNIFTAGLFITLLTLLINITLFQETMLFVLIYTPLFIFFFTLGVLFSTASVYIKYPSLIAFVFILTSAQIEKIYTPNPQEMYVEDRVTIKADKEIVWKYITPLSIKNDNLENFSILKLLNVPRPVEAKLETQGVGAVRVSIWERGYIFKEKIIYWSENEEMKYKFFFNLNNSNKPFFDNRIEPGSRYFSPRVGGYKVVKDKNDITLKLYTYVDINLPFAIYTNNVLEFILSNYHQKILKIIKKNSEKS